MAVNTAAAHAPAQTALLLLDYHNQIVDNMPAETKAQVLSAARTLRDAARSSGATIVHCLIDVSAEPVETSKLRQRWDEQFKPVIAASPEKLHEHQDVAASSTSSSDQEFASVKIPGCVSALKTERLKAALAARGIKSLLICGVITSGAVLSTARDAADLGFVTTVVEDGCWDYNPDAHSAVLKHILPMTAYTTDLKGGLGLLTGSA